MSSAEFSAVDVFSDCSKKRMEESLVTSLVMEISLFVGRIWSIGRRPVWVWLSYFCTFGKWPAVLRDCSPCVVDGPWSLYDAV